MKRSRFTEQQIAFALKQQEVGTPVDEICRKMGISDATFYKWKKKYSGLGPSELRRLATGLRGVDVVRVIDAVTATSAFMCCSSERAGR